MGPKNHNVARSIHRIDRILVSSANMHHICIATDIVDCIRSQRLAHTRNTKECCSKGELYHYAKRLYFIQLMHCFILFMIAQRQVDTIKTALEAGLIAILPPMYFFAHLYYTDILSITTVLAMFLCNLKYRHHSAAFFGNFSISSIFPLYNYPKLTPSG